MSTPSDPDADTVELIPVAQLLNLARLGVAMRAAQRQYLKNPPADDTAKRFDSYCKAALKCRRELVKLGELVALALLGREVRRELQPPSGRPVTPEYQAAKIAQRRFDAAVSAALDRQQPLLPGMGGGEGGGSA